MLVLASASPRRRELVAGLGLGFRVEAADVDETPPRGASPEEAARAIARRKALAVAPRSGDDPILAADTIVVAADGEILGKPRDAADACRMLGKLSGTTHRVITGVCLVTGRGARVDVESDVTLVTMRRLTDGEVQAYVDSGECFDKAGSYAIQETGDRFVTRVEGSWTNVVGLPMELVRRLLDENGLGTGQWA
jgi:septum formation protein